MARAVRFLLAASLAVSASGAAAAEDPSASFPNRPIRMIVPFPAGGPSDIVARLIGQTMSQDWGQPVVIENRPGANTIIGAQAAAKAAPDGYTLFMAIDSTLVMNQFVHKKGGPLRSPEPPGAKQLLALSITFRSLLTGSSLAAKSSRSKPAQATLFIIH